MTTYRTFRGRPTQMRQSESGNEGIGEVRIVEFGVIDKEVPVGASERQVIDKGAFREMLTRDVPLKRKFFADHGDAHMTGFARSEMILGYADNFREEDDGLYFTAHYNLRTAPGELAYEQARFAEDLTEFSMRTPIAGEETAEDDDGVEHVTKIADIEEVSQVGFGAQAGTALVALRSAIRPHGGGTSDASWDGPANERRCPNTEAALTAAHAWKDPDGDPEAKASYKFIHHEVAEGGRVGAANAQACSTGIGVLNGGRGGTTIPDSDRAGVYAHLARHLRDADQEPPELRAGGSDEDVFRSLGGAKLKRHMGATADHGGHDTPDNILDALDDDESLATHRKMHEKGKRPGHDHLSSSLRDLTVPSLEDVAALIGSADWRKLVEENPQEREYARTLAASLAEVAAEPPPERDPVREFYAEVFENA